VLAIIRREEGVAATELALVLLILVPIILITIQFYEIFEVRHAMIKAARYAVWQRAMGNAPSSGDVSGKFGNRSGLGGLNLSGSDGNSFTLPGGGLLATAMSLANLNSRGRWTYDVSGTQRFRSFWMAGFVQIPVRERQVMQTDAWKARGLNDVRSVVNRMSIVSALVPQGVDDILQFFLDFRLRNNVDPQLRVP
jgi:hypothetical protein